MHRFYSPHPLTQQLKLSQGDQFHQIFQVFRCSRGDSVIFFESGGDDVVYEVMEIGKKEALFVAKKVIEKVKIPYFHLKVFLAYPHKISTLELIVQKLTELGVTEIIFFTAQHSQIDSISENKQQRLNTISLEALEQSGRNNPVVLTYTSKNIEKILMEYAHTTMVVGSPHQGNATMLPRVYTSPVGFWVGPEGGWSEKEMDYFEKQKLHLWKFNQNILRMETAAIVGSGMLIHCLPLIQQ